MQNNKKKISSKKPLDTAVLFLVFNRPDVTKKVFEEIRKAKPPRLYVAADGARKDKAGELEKVKMVRQIATNVDWFCEVKTLFRDKNLGCKYAVSQGIDWFFENEEMGIILEDDCLPHPDFFVFCNTLLHYYLYNESVWVVTGNNFQDGIKRGNFSYYFSSHAHIWGWATWSRAWLNYDINISFFNTWKNSSDWQHTFPDNVERKQWRKIYSKVRSGMIDTWDYQWDASVRYHKGLTATPNVNLITNIGFGEDATHTTSSENKFSNMPSQCLGEIIYPKEIFQNIDADKYVSKHVFGVRHLNSFEDIIFLVMKSIKYIKNKLLLKIITKKR